MRGAEKNKLIVIKGVPCVHLKDHYSQCFNPIKKRYFYCGCPDKESTIEEFQKACEKYNCGVYIFNNNITFWRDGNRIEIKEDGDVIINGEKFTIDQQIEPAWF